ncbi:MAG: hypothetical protein IJC26_03905, partial [Clostridia bacterium]|nr:hypothetical protein [Clostridia bacterium]
DTQHWRECGCGNKIDIANHIFDNDCDTTCNICGAERQVPDHIYDDAKDLICNECGFERPPYVPGDLDGVEGVDMDDAIYLLFYCSFAEEYPINQNADFDNSGEVDMDDAIYLLFYCSFPEDYPLNQSPSSDREDPFEGRDPVITPTPVVPLD